MYTQEATVPAGLNPTEFNVRISVGADGSVKHVSNAHLLPAPLFRAAADAAKKWRFPSHRDGGRTHAFDAEITFYGPVAGRVTSIEGTPVAGVLVSGSQWKCCPPEQDVTTTDKSGIFRIEHPGTVLHFFPNKSFQPQSLVVAPKTFTQNIVLSPVSTSLTVEACGELEHGSERIGLGLNRLQFDVPQQDVRLVRGKADVDYIVHMVKANGSDDDVEFWFGPYAMNSMPDDEQFVESKTFITRNVVMPRGLVQGSEGGVVGSDVRGSLPNGKMWRQMAVGHEGARYQDVSPQHAALFDRIIDSACWIPDTVSSTDHVIQSPLLAK